MRRGLVAALGSLSVHAVAVGAVVAVVAGVEPSARVVAFTMTGARVHRVCVRVNGGPDAACVTLTPE